MTMVSFYIHFPIISDPKFLTTGTSESTGPSGGRYKRHSLASVAKTAGTRMIDALLNQDGVQPQDISQSSYPSHPSDHMSNDNAASIHSNAHSGTTDTARLQAAVGALTSPFPLFEHIRPMVNEEQILCILFPSYCGSGRRTRRAASDPRGRPARCGSWARLRTFRNDTGSFYAHYKPEGGYELRPIPQRKRRSVSFPPVASSPLR